MHTAFLIQLIRYSVLYKIRGAFKKFVADTVNYEIRTSYFVTFQHRHLQLKCT